nr:MAG TPA: hypothetical protein [Caudoviricetes sp.]
MNDCIKKLTKISMNMLNEAGNYSDLYKDAKDMNDSLMADLYYNLAQLHLDGFQRVHTTMSSYLSRNRDEALEEVYKLLRDVEDGLFNSVKEKLSK